MMNKFCIYCVSNTNTQSPKNCQMVNECEDTGCPFYPFRQADIDHEDDEEIANKLKGE